MKILYVSPFPPARDGIGTYTQAFTAKMLGEGHDVRVVVPRSIPNSPPEVTGAIGSRASQLTELHDTVTSWNPDVVHVQFAVAAFGSRTFRLMRWIKMLRRDLTAPIVVTMHEVTRDTAALRLAGRIVYRLIARSSDRIIVHTDAAFAALTEVMGVPQGRVSIIPHPRACPPDSGSIPDEIRARFGLGDSRILLAFGFIHVDKGLGDLVHGLGIIKRSGTVSFDDIRVVVAGAVRPRSGVFRVFEARDRIHLRLVLRQAERYGIDHYLVMTGYVPEADVAAWFCAADAVVLPYRRTEQSGVAGLANAFGVAVLASAVGGLSEQIANSRWTFPPGDPGRLAQVLADFLRSPRDYQISYPLESQSPDLATAVAATLRTYRMAHASAETKRSWSLQAKPAGSDTGRALEDVHHVK